MCLEDLGFEVWTLVLSHLGLRDCTACLTLSTGTRRTLLNDRIWKHLCLDLFRDLGLGDPAEWLNPGYKAKWHYDAHLCPTTYRCARGHLGRGIWERVCVPTLAPSAAEPQCHHLRATNRGVYYLARHYQRICGFWTTSCCCDWYGRDVSEATIVRFRLVPQGLEVDGFHVMQGPMRRQQWACIYPG